MGQERRRVTESGTSSAGAQWTPLLPLRCAVESGCAPPPTSPPRLRSRWLPPHLLAGSGGRLACAAAGVRRCRPSHWLRRSHRLGAEFKLGEEEGAKACEIKMVCGGRRRRLDKIVRTVGLRGSNERGCVHSRRRTSYP